MMHDRRQAVFLKEMGYTLWQLRQGGDPADGNPADGNCRGGYYPSADDAECRGGYHPPAEASDPARESARERAREITQEVFMQEALRKVPESSAVSLPVAHEPFTPTVCPPEERKAADSTRDERAKAIALMGWEDLTEAIRECRACELCRHRKQAVPGVGDRAAEWLFIGEGPGAEEDARGEPFVGQAGRLLDSMLAAIGLKRGENVYIANAVKCRPEGNRTPLPAEMAACRPFLMRQIALIRPAVIVLLGKAATHSVLEDDASLALLRKKSHVFGDIPVVVTYHPAYLLRNLPEKAKAWEDLCLARKCWREAREKG